MAEKGRELLRTEYGVPGEKIEVIPHGIPDYPFLEPDVSKGKLGFDGKPIILTFGLLSPNKGVEFMIDAMPAILKSRTDAVYVVLGATHPNLVREQGEAYRERLITRTRALGVKAHVVFLNQFVDQASTACWKSPVSSHWRRVDVVCGWAPVWVFFIAALAAFIPR